MGVLVGVSVLLLATLIHARGASLDYEYLPQNDRHQVFRSRSGVASFTSQPDYDAKIHKCTCGGDEVRDGTGCSEAQTYVAVMDPSTNKVTAALTSAFQVVVGEVECAEDKDVKVSLDPNRGHTSQFCLLPNGSLSWQGHPYGNYCFDHTLDKDGLPNSWEAKVCIPLPVVPRCCHGSSLASDGSCDTPAHQRSSPPVLVNGLVTQWPGQVPERSVTLKCKKYENLQTLPLNTREANLTYSAGSVSLVWAKTSTTQAIEGDAFCVEQTEGDEYVASFCYEDQAAIHDELCSGATCVRKCCAEGEIMHGIDCIPVGDKTELLWVPTFTDANDLESNVEPPGDLTWLHGLPQCDLLVLNPDVEEKDKFLLLNNGILLRPLLDETYVSTHYCIDNFMSSEGKLETLALACFPEVDVVCSTVKDQVYPALLLVSSVFLGITLVVYISVPEIRDKLHGRCLISLVTALFVAYTLLATTRLAGGSLPPSLCSFLASVTHLSMLAAFFWLNVMCFDIWRTLRKTRTVVDGGHAGRRRFLLYSLYAWGCPLFITVMAVIMESLPPSHDVIRPNFKVYCWFQDQASHWLYLYGWVLALVLSNVVFFSLVATILCRAQNDPLLKRSREYNRERMWLYAKLFLVMGVTWVAEVVSWQAGACRALIAINIVNALQGLTLFLVFVCKRNVLEKVKTRCGCAGVRPNHRLTTITSSFSVSSSSSACKTRESSLSASVKSSTSMKNFSASPSMRTRNGASAVPLQTLLEAPDEASEPSCGDLQDTAATFQERDRETGLADGTTEEITPLKTDSPQPERSHEIRVES